MRSCIIETTPANRPIIEAHLPPGVKVAAFNDPFDRPLIELRLEGYGLPPWTEQHQSSQFYMRATASIDADGDMHLSPGMGVPVQQIHPDVKE